MSQRNGSYLTRHSSGIDCIRSKVVVVVHSSLFQFDLPLVSVDLYCNRMHASFQ